MILQKLVLLVIIISSNLFYAQADFRPGFIIHNSGDTLYGKIDYRSDITMKRSCKFMSNDNSTSDFSPYDILGFRFTDSKYYVSREINKKRIFLEYLIKGKVNIFYMRDIDGRHYYLEKEGLELAELTHKQGTKYVDGKKVFYESAKHIGLLNYYMQDAPEFQSRIKAIKRPEHQTLINLAEDYHKATAEGEDYIIYAKPAPFVKLFPEIVGGVVRYSNLEDLNDKMYVRIGIMGHFWLPRISAKLYFKTGVLFSQLDVNSDKVNFYKIPLHIEYIHSQGIFRPRFSYGINFYNPGNETVSFDIGTNVKLTENLFLSVTSDVEFEDNKLFFPGEFLSYSVKLGLFMKLD